MSDEPDPKRPRGSEATIIDGKAVAATIRTEVKALVDELRRDHSITPGLAVVLVGQRTDSATYVRMKKRAAAECGFHSVDLDFEADVTQEKLEAAIDGLNADDKVHGILVQLPLPKHIDEAAVLKAIDVAKDADGFSALNIGNMCLRGGDPPMPLPALELKGAQELVLEVDVADDLHVADRADWLRMLLVRS